DIYTDYKGRRVYFCCQACKTEFEKDPQEYVSKLPQFQQTALSAFYDISGLVIRLLVRVLLCVKTLPRIQFDPPESSNRLLIRIRPLPACERAGKYLILRHR
ncbi:MAG TPA: YHS domain-containing protein, partial [Sedimentisphaerales bacterium]|nr:YHS domain-containing protein [Sedimentisphaerales bacterium]